MQKVCRKCSCEFLITDGDREFFQVMEIPLPTLCSDCRMQRRLAWRNERFLYRRKCNATGKPVITVYSSDVEAPVYCPEYWWGDEWDGTDYGREFDFGRGFFEQFGELIKVVPRWSKIVINGENSEYCANSADVKNCYLCFSTAFSQDCFYGLRIFHSSDCVDCLNVSKSEKCYECVDCEGLYGGGFVQNSKQCVNCSFCYDCVGCEECFLSAGLRRKKYYILNKEYSEEEYFKKKAQYLEKGADELNKLLKKVVETVPRRAMTNYSSEGCTGDFVCNSRNVTDSFYVFDSEDSRWINDGEKVVKSYDCSYPDEFVQCYEVSSCYKINNCMFLNNSVSCSDCLYCESCLNCEDCFGCVGLKRKKYCIFNKQYSKEEYEVLKGKIVEHMKKIAEWGEFFPVSLSPFSYNQTVAGTLQPLKKDEVLNNGWRWFDDVEVAQVEGRVLREDELRDFDDGVIDEVLLCSISGRGYKIAKQELEFYRDMDLPLPRVHPDLRFERRLGLRGARSLSEVECAGCGKMVETNVEGGKVYCDECYLELVG